LAAFTATATDKVREDMINILRLEEPDIFISGFDRENLNLKVLRGENKLDYVVDYVSEKINTTGIVYAATRREAETVYINLKKRNIKAALYHAGLSDSDREKAQEDFSYDNVDVIVATNAFGMGIDKSNVRYVIHYNMPKNIEAYYQEIGRAGRDGEASECILLFSPKDIQTQKYFIDMRELNPVKKAQEYNNLRTMVDYTYTSMCLRKYILEYFGEENIKDSCNNCSVCNDDRETIDMTIEAQKIFSCVYRMKERYGTNVIAEVLKGSTNAKILNLGLDKLSTYGIVKNYTKKELVDIINKLIADDYMITTDDEFPVVKLRQKAVPVLRSEEKVFLKINKKPESKKGKVDNTLFEALRLLRKDIALNEKIPPYLVFADASLKEMTEYMPVTKEDFLNIKGVGQSKYNKYGEVFIEEIKKYIKENNITKEVAMDNEKVDSTEKIKSHIITYNMYKEGKTIKEVSKERELTEVTIEEHLFKCKTEGLDVNLDDFIQKEYEELIIETIKNVGAEKFKPIKELLPKEVTYLSIKSVLLKYNSDL
jgi:ATP-dependent DNA helicase RecQ